MCFYGVMLEGYSEFVHMIGTCFRVQEIHFVCNKMTLTSKSHLLKGSLGPHYGQEQGQEQG